MPDYGQWQAHIPPDVSKNDETIETDAVESMDSDEIASNGTDVVEQSVDETMNQGVSNDMSHRFRKVEILQRKGKSHGLFVLIVKIVIVYYTLIPFSQYHHTDYSKVYIVEGIFGDIKKRKYVLKTIEKFEPFVFHACVEFKILRSVAKKPFLMQMVYAYQTIDTLDIVLGKMQPKCRYNIFTNTHNYIYPSMNFIVCHFASFQNIMVAVISLICCVRRANLPKAGLGFISQRSY